MAISSIVVILLCIYIWVIGKDVESRSFKLYDPEAERKMEEEIKALREYTAAKKRNKKFMDELLRRSLINVKE